MHALVAHPSHCSDLSGASCLGSPAFTGSLAHQRSAGVSDFSR
jgi:hypothetical protein